MLPRCTGMCGAFATSGAVMRETRRKKSSRSLDVDRIGGVLQRDGPICSAIDMNRLLNTSSMIGSAFGPIAMCA